MPSIVIGIVVVNYSMYSYNYLLFANALNASNTNKSCINNMRLNADNVRCSICHKAGNIMKESQEHVEVVSLQPSLGRNQAKGVMMNESISPSKRMTWIPLSSPLLLLLLPRSTAKWANIFQAPRF